MSPTFCASLLRSLFLTVLVLLAASTAHGKAVRPGFRPESLFKQADPRCLTTKDFQLPQTVKVNISIISTNQNTKTSADISNRSLAPWDYRINEDPNRFPQVIADAKCRHTSCVDLAGQLDYSGSSVPIYQEILVLRREQRGCHHSYWLEKKMITVGCTCVHPIIQHQA
ncbi:interleukin-17A-like [Nothoprocta perdicaria]|uniref:Interleukin-17A-like n=1 Tax=Nothoprocta perdicaria TaxID=30464 RepID=A0A8C6ZA51_NOTPE|nr:interleukin-17A-like [Nothoprocta perdicaria]